MNGSSGTHGVEGTRFHEVRWVGETGSTNRDLLDEAARGAAEGLVLVADHQTAGRGRLDRTWTAPSGASLLVSVLLRPDLAPDRLFLLTLACGTAAIEGVEEVTGVRLGLKWPNDLVVADGPLLDRKVAGILAESHVASGGIAVVVGMGLNVDWPTELPADLAATAASLDRLAPVVERSDVLRAWLRAYDRWLDRLVDDGGVDELLDAVRSRSATIGRRVRVELADGSFEGVAGGIDDDGALIVGLDDGESRIVRVGDVVHARPID